MTSIFHDEYLREKHQHEQAIRRLAGEAHTSAVDHASRAYALAVASAAKLFIETKDMAAFKLAIGEASVSYEQALRSAGFMVSSIIENRSGL